MAGISESFFHMQERDCGSIYDMKMYVEPNEIEPLSPSLSLSMSLSLTHANIIPR